MEQNQAPTTAPELTPEQQHIQRLASDLQALQTIVGVLLIRAQGTLILKADQRRRFEQELQRNGHYPRLEINPHGSGGDLKITHRWGPLEETAPARTGIPIHHLLEGLAYMGLASIEVDEIRSWSPEVQRQVVEWCAANYAQRNAGDGAPPTVVPPTPEVLVAALAALPKVEPECGNETPLEAQETQVPGAESSEGIDACREPVV